MVHVGRGKVLEGRTERRLQLGGARSRLLVTPWLASPEDNVTSGSVGVVPEDSCVLRYQGSQGNKATALSERSPSSIRRRSAR